MSIYVDRTRRQYGRMIMCHMLADTTAELDAMADRLGVARKWKQKAGKPDEHYDVCLAKRRMALEAGAIDADRETVVALIRGKRLFVAEAAASMRADMYGGADD